MILEDFPSLIINFKAKDTLCKDTKFDVGSWGKSLLETFFEIDYGKWRNKRSPINTFLMFIVLLSKSNIFYVTPPNVSILSGFDHYDSQVSNIIDEHNKKILSNIEFTASLKKFYSSCPNWYLSQIDESILYGCLASNGSLIRHIRNPDKTLIYQAYRQTEDSLQYASDTIINDKSFVKLMKSIKDEKISLSGLCAKPSRQYDIDPFVTD